MKRLILLLIATLAISSSLFAQEGSGLFRFVHSIPGVGAVDIYIDGELAVIDLGYGSASNYIAVDGGAHQVIVRPTGLRTELWRQQIGAIADVPLTLVAAGIDPLEFVAYEDDFSSVDLGITRFRLIHAIESSATVDVLFEDQAVVTDLAYKASSGGFDIEAGSYSFAIAVGDNEPVALEFNLVSNTSYLILVHGTPNNPQITPLTAPIAGQGNAGSVRLANFGDQAVDIYFEETLIVPNADFGVVTEHLNFVAGTYAVDVRVAGTDEPVAQTDLEISADGASTLVVIADDVSVFEDDLSGVTVETGAVNVINTIADSTVTVAVDEVVLASEVAFNTASGANAVAPIRSLGTLTLTLDGQSQDVPLGFVSVYGGVYTDAFVVLDTTGVFPQPSVIFADTLLGHSLNSLPTVGVVEIPEEETVVDEPVVDQTPIVEEPEETVVEEPVVEETLIAPVTPASPVFAGPTGRIQNLNPGANLNLRQYPRGDAFILGQVQVGTTLAVNGRAGAELDAEGNPIDPEYVDPVTLLEEGQDLNPADTWLNVVYSTPDGGQITAWVNAQYILLRDARGNWSLFRDLDVIPANQAGEALNTSVTPPTAAAPSVTVRIQNLNPGVNLNIRRTPEATGEILFGIPVGTVTALTGVDADYEWGFIRYSPLQGGVVTGWVNLQYAGVELNGNVVSIESLIEQGLLEVIEVERRGDVSADAPAAPVPTVDPTRNAYIARVQVNPDANLNLRRNPDAQSEVLEQIPSQTQLIVTQRTADELWLQTSYNGQTGWVASAFVTVTYNGLAVELEEIPALPAPTAEPTPEGEEGQ
jgi:uncharacterized protein YgiM (DUF1202 family)